jgi:hypothetical protein
MKKLSLIALVAAALCACGEKQTTEDCIAWIYDNARMNTIVTVSGSGTEQREILELKDNDGQWLEINKETALSLSKNWTFDENMQYYTKDDVILEHEKDACEVVGRIKNFLNHAPGFIEP